jgi:uncharacterized protein (DUF1330 family)
MPQSKPPGHIQFLTELNHDGPVDMVNLFKFHDIAQYEEGSKEPERTGREAFATYVRELKPIVKPAGTGTEIWRGAVHFDLTANSTDTWDEMLVVRYPSRAALIDLLSSKAFHHIHHHRAAALADSKTWVCTAL